MFTDAKHITRTLFLLATLALVASACTPQEFDRSISATDAANAVNASRTLEEQEVLIFNPFIDTDEDPLATWSVDVDTASYTLARRKINEGSLPDPNRIRVEEFMNYFRYDYPAPSPDDADPFSITLEAAPSYFGDNLHMLRVGIKGVEIPSDERPVANVVLVIDVSGSMQAGDRIGFVKYASKQIINSLSDRDMVSIVTYAGEEKVLLEPTEAVNRTKIINAIDGLVTEGGTNGAAGIQRAYELAESVRCTNRPDIRLQVSCDNAINRVILATDGDFNVGVTEGELVNLVSSWGDRGIFLSAFGVGDDPNDAFMEQLTNNGNGNYYYLDSLAEAKRVLSEEFSGAIQVIAKDVKVQVEFNPDVISRYRLVGYENRVLNDEDFRDDSVDAGEIGSGHTVTAYLEFEMFEQVKKPGAGILQTEIEEEYAESQFIDVRIRYKDPNGTASKEVVRIVPLASLQTSFNDATDDFRYAAAVAEFAEVLRTSPYAEGARFDEIHAVASEALGAQAENRREFLEIVTKAKGLWATSPLSGNVPTETTTE